MATVSTTLYANKLYSQDGLYSTAGNPQIMLGRISPDSTRFRLADLDAGEVTITTAGAVGTQFLSAWLLKVSGSGTGPDAISLQVDKQHSYYAVRVNTTDQGTPSYVGTDASSGTSFVTSGSTLTAYMSDDANEPIECDYEIVAIAADADGNNQTPVYIQFQGEGSAMNVIVNAESELLVMVAPYTYSSNTLQEPSFVFHRTFHPVGSVPDVYVYPERDDENFLPPADLAEELYDGLNQANPTTHAVMQIRVSDALVETIDVDEPDDDGDEDVLRVYKDSVDGNGVATYVIFVDPTLASHASRSYRSFVTVMIQGMSTSKNETFSFNFSMLTTPTWQAEYLTGTSDDTLMYQETGATPTQYLVEERQVGSTGGVLTFASVTRDDSLTISDAAYSQSGVGTGIYGSVVDDSGPTFSLQLDKNEGTTVDYTSENEVVLAAESFLGTITYVENGRSFDITSAVLTAFDAVSSVTASLKLFKTLEINPSSVVTSQVHDAANTYSAIELEALDKVSDSAAATQDITSIPVGYTVDADTPNTYLLKAVDFLYGYGTAALTGVSGDQFTTSDAAVSSGVLSLSMPSEFATTNRNVDSTQTVTMTVSHGVSLTTSEDVYTTTFSVDVVVLASPTTTSINSEVDYGWDSGAANASAVDYSTNPDYPSVDSYKGVDTNGYRMYEFDSATPGDRTLVWRAWVENPLTGTTTEVAYGEDWTAYIGEDEIPSSGFTDAGIVEALVNLDGDDPMIHLNAGHLRTAVAGTVYAINIIENGRTFSVLDEQTIAAFNKIVVTTVNMNPSSITGSYIDAHDAEGTFSIEESAEVSFGAVYQYGYGTYDFVLSGLTDTDQSVAVNDVTASDSSSTAFGQFTWTNVPTAVSGTTSANHVGFITAEATPDISELSGASAETPGDYDIYVFPDLAVGDTTESETDRAGDALPVYESTDVFAGGAAMVMSEGGLVTEFEEETMTGIRLAFPGMATHLQGSDLSDVHLEIYSEEVDGVTVPAIRSIYDDFIVCGVGVDVLRVSSSAGGLVERSSNNYVRINQTPTITLEGATTVTSTLARTMAVTPADTTIANLTFTTEGGTTYSGGEWDDAGEAVEYYGLSELRVQVRRYGEDWKDVRSTNDTEIAVADESSLVYAKLTLLEAPNRAFDSYVDYDEMDPAEKLKLQKNWQRFNIELLTRGDAPLYGEQFDVRIISPELSLGAEVILSEITSDAWTVNMSASAWYPSTSAGEFDTEWDGLFQNHERTDGLYTADGDHSVDIHGKTVMNTLSGYSTDSFIDYIDDNVRDLFVRDETDAGFTIVLPSYADHGWTLRLQTVDGSGALTSTLYTSASINLYNGETYDSSYTHDLSSYQGTTQFQLAVTFGDTDNFSTGDRFAIVLVDGDSNAVLRMDFWAINLQKPASISLSPNLYSTYPDYLTFSLSDSSVTFDGNFGDDTTTRTLSEVASRVDTYPSPACDVIIQSCSRDRAGDESNFITRLECSNVGLSDLTAMLSGLPMRFLAGETLTTGDSGGEAVAAHYQADMRTDGASTDSAQFLVYRIGFRNADDDSIAQSSSLSDTYTFTTFSVYDDLVSSWESSTATFKDRVTPVGDFWRREVSSDADQSTLIDARLVAWPDNLVAGNPDVVPMTGEDPTWSGYAYTIGFISVRSSILA